MEPLWAASYLKSHGVGYDEEDPQGQPCFIGSVAPQAMSSGCDTQTGNHVVEYSCQETAGELPTIASPVRPRV